MKTEETDDREQTPLIHYSNGAVTGRVIGYRARKGQGYFENDGHTYFFRTNSSSINLNYALNHRLKRDSIITLRFWPVVPFPELLNNPVHLKVHSFPKLPQWNINTVKICGIVHHSEVGRCIIQVPSLQRHKNYYSSVVSEKTFQPGICVKVDGLLREGRIVAKAIKEESIPESLPSQ